VTTSDFDVDRMLRILFEHGVMRLNPLDAEFPARRGQLKARVRLRREDTGGSSDGTPEFYFTDPDGIPVQIQHTSYCAGSGYLGDVCTTEPELAPTAGLLAVRDLNHVTLGVSNQQRSRAFYRDLFSMKVQTYQGESPIYAIGDGPQFIAFGSGTANGGIPGTPNIAHFCMTVEDFEVDRVLQTLADFGVKPRGNAAGPAPPLVSYVVMRREDRGGAPAGTPELYFTDPDGIVVQLQHPSYCGGAGSFGEVCTAA
jgi:catechol 2,3-dioxygenase-like lactoylglutathione lyase family enzyme